MYEEMNIWLVCIGAHLGANLGKPSDIYSWSVVVIMLGYDMLYLVPWISSYVRYYNKELFHKSEKDSLSFQCIF